MGHIVKKNGVMVDPKKVRAVTEWQIPTNVSEICSFLSLARYYIRFVEGFSKIAAPMAKLLQKSVKFNWSHKCEQSFNELRRRLV